MEIVHGIPQCFKQQDSENIKLCIYEYACDRIIIISHQHISCISNLI